ncbi:MAG: phospholipid carrier-dependent glycosyltransferase [Rhizobiales bacterium]|nr:phospholipid carrier-dependent glycosyltransferase [Hyphomicrobiales bacterium]
MVAAVGNDWRRASRGLPTLLDLATRSHRRCVMLLVVATLLSILPGFFRIPPTDRDESRFAQATKQMIETGDFIDIRYQDTTRYKKPVGIYWLQAGVVKAAQWLGKRDAMTTIWLYRIPSLLGAIGAVLLSYWAALAFLSQRSALLAGLMMASCLLLSVEGRIAKTDACLLLTAVAAMGAMARAYLPEQRAKLEGPPSWIVPAIFWTALAASVLLKGPVIPMIVFLTAATLVIVDRSFRWVFALRPIVGAIWFALLVLPWFAAITMRAGDDFFAESIGQDLLSKLLQGQESHGAPPGYYFFLFWLTFWPGATLAAIATPSVFASRHEPGAKFLLAWIVPTWILLELVVTKLPHYVLPLYPAIAILIAGFVGARVLPSKSWLEQGTMWWFVLPVILGLLGLGLLTFVGRQFGLLSWPLIGASMVMGFRAWQLYNSDGPEHSLLRGIVASFLIVAAVFGLIVPSLHYVFPSVTLASVLHDSDCREPVAAAAGYGEASVVFQIGTATRQTDGAGAAEFLRGGECRFAFVEARQEHNFAQRAEAIGLLYSAVTRLEGFNIGSGRTVTVAVYRSGSPP